MKTIGVLGGMSWQSTAEYYRALNVAVAERLGGFSSAEVLIASVDFAQIQTAQREDRWDDAGEMLAERAARLQQAGAELLLLATNTMHRVAPVIEAVVQIPFLHIVDPTADALHADGHRRVGLLGTRYTMEAPFWRQRLRDRAGVEAVVPDVADRVLVHDVIFDELVHGVVNEASRRRYLEVIDRLRDQGATAVILGCTEIMLLVASHDLPVAGYDTTTLHVQAAVEAALT